MINNGLFNSTKLPIKVGSLFWVLDYFMKIKIDKLLL
jgi:hypothetical protein